MANFLQGDVLFGQNALTNTTSFINQIDSLTIQNGKFKHVNIYNQYDPTLTSVEPVDWQDDFIMDAPFDNGIGGGSVGNLLGVANQLLIKRRPTDMYTDIAEGWITIARIPILTSDDLQFEIYDYTCKCNTEYEYVIVPTLIQNQGGLRVQIETSITSDSVRLTAMSEFDKIYICSATDARAIYAGTSYDTMNTERLSGTHQTLGNKYPIVVTNSKVNYHTGGVQGTILNKNYGRNDVITGEMTDLNRQAIIEARKDFDEFITQGKPFVLKDWNGNIWLIIVTDSPSYSWVNEWGMGLGTIAFSWTEIGDVNDQEDLDVANMVQWGGGDE